MSLRKKMEAMHELGGGHRHSGPFHATREGLTSGAHEEVGGHGTADGEEGGEGELKP